MKDWFDNLQPRERMIVLAGGAITLVILLWALIWNPITTRTVELRDAVASDQELLDWMQDADNRIKSAQQQPGNKPRKTNVTLINAVESTSKRSGLRAAITNIKPDGDSKINLDIKEANFNDMIRWQGQLLTDFGIRAEQFTAKPGEKAGMVDARLTLTR